MTGHDDDQPNDPLEEVTPLGDIVPPSMEQVRADQAHDPTEPVVTTIITGQPWPWSEGLVSQPSAGWLPDPNVLLIVERGITDQMVEELTGPIEAVLLASGPMVGLMIRFHGPGGRGSGWEWQEVFSWRHPGDGLPDWADPNVAGDHLGFTVVAVDADTKIVHYQAFFTVSPHFTRSIIREVRDRWQPGVTPAEGLAARAAWNAKHPTIRAALKAGIARSRSGD